MSGRLLIIGLLGFTAVFAAALVWFQFFAYYERTSAAPAVSVAGRPVALADYEGVDATSSPLKLRGCFRADLQDFAAASPLPDAEPLVAPFWFRCFDAAVLGRDLVAGRATAYGIAYDAPEGFDLVAAIYPDGRGYLWRQLNDRYRN